METAKVMPTLRAMEIDGDEVSFPFSKTSGVRSSCYMLQQSGMFFRTRRDGKFIKVVRVNPPDESEPSKSDTDAF